MSEYRSILEQALAANRTKASWNERLTHWERPASDAEEARVERAARAARTIVCENLTLIGEAASVQPQGSYFNNTNVRLEADMDLRVQLPSIQVRYAPGVDSEHPALAGHYVWGRRTIAEIAGTVRDELARDCRQRFGAENVRVGTKAITVGGLSGTRADVDLVPAFHFHWISQDARGGFHTSRGVVIVGTDGSETINFPEQHNANGIAKRGRTLHRFKKVVRILKRLNYELAELELIPRRLPSFLVECLVYLVEDAHFMVDDRYDRLRLVCEQLFTILADREAAFELYEINEVKFLFHENQAWSLNEARAFIEASLHRLEA